MRQYGLLFALALVLPCCLSAQQPDPDLTKYIDSIRAIDNHAHVVAPDLEHDKQYDALRCDALPVTNSFAPANFRFGPDVLAAWKALYGFSGKSEADARSTEFKNRVAAVRKQHAADFQTWVLQQSGIDTVLANRVAMATQLSKDHFQWVPYDDALLFPLDNSKLQAANPDRKALFEMEEPILKSYLADSGLNALPATVDDYVAKVIKPTLARQKSDGAVAIKFEAAYLRSLDFQAADHDAAAAIFGYYAEGGAPPAADYKLLQDYLFHQIALEAGRLGLPIQIHTGIGCGEYFNDAGSDPMLLEAVINDPEVRHTDFVLLHGGFPFDRHIVPLILKPNVYVDTSMLELLFSPQELARILRPWLETMPERILFGTDATPVGPGYSWEETTWIGSRNARKALAIALTQMMNDGVVTRDRAKQIANGILRQNVTDLYFKSH